MLDASSVPRLDELPRAERTASKALLSLGMHVRSEADLALVDAARDRTLPGLDSFGEPRHYSTYILAALPEQWRAIVEEQMKIDLSELEPIAARIEAMYIEKGIEKGIETGRLAELRSSIVRIAKRRGWSLESRHEQRLASCRDYARLELWFDRMLMADTLDAALD